MSVIDGDAEARDPEPAAALRARGHGSPADGLSALNISAKGATAGSPGRFRIRRPRDKGVEGPTAPALPLSADLRADAISESSCWCLPSIPRLRPARLRFSIPKQQ